MPGDDAIKVAGRVVEVLPKLLFWVELKNGHRILAHVARRLELDCKLLAPGDKVRVQMSSFDLSKGCITDCGK